MTIIAQDNFEGGTWEGRDDAPKRPEPPPHVLQKMKPGDVVGYVIDATGERWFINGAEVIEP